MERWRRYGRDYLIVLQDNTCLAPAWQEYRGLRRLSGPGEQHCLWWGQRRYVSLRANDIQDNRAANRRKTLTLDLVVCEETWKELHEQGLPVSRRVRHAWKPILRTGER